MLKEIVIAAQSWAAARRFILQHRLFKWIAVPGIIYTLLFIAGMYFFLQSAESVMEWINDKMGVQKWLQKERNQWLNFIFLMNGMMLQLVLMLSYFSLFKYMILIIGSPLFAYLNEKTEAIIQHKEHTLNRADLKKDAKRGVLLALRNAGWQLLYLALLILLSLVPIAGWVAPVIVLLMEGYYFGVSMLDYSLAKSGFTLSQSIAYTGRHKGLAIGNGLLFFLMHILIILAPAYAIIAATHCVHTLKED